jgi:hypothetical protein
MGMMMMMVVAMDRLRTAIIKPSVLKARVGGAKRTEFKARLGAMERETRAAISYLSFSTLARSAQILFL